MRCNRIQFPNGRCLAQVMDEQRSVEQTGNSNPPCA